MNIKDRYPQSERGNTIIVVLSVVATILGLLGSAVAYTQHVSRVSDRSRKAAQALEVGDGHLEFLFTHWRNISRAPAFRYTIKQPPTNFFFTEMYNPGPAPTPWTSPAPAPAPWPGAPLPIPTPAASNFPNVPYEITQYRIQAVNPTIETDAAGTSTLGPAQFPIPGDGPNYWQYSIYYLASVDVKVKAMNGYVTSKVRRVFEKKYDNPWTYAVFYHDDLEFHPSSAMTITGPIHTNSSLYIATSHFTTLGKAAYAGEYVNGFAPQDKRSSDGTAVTAPNFPANMPPSEESPYLPFGWNLKLTNADGSQNNDSYHELIERPLAEGVADALGDVRLYNQAGVKVLIDQSNTVTVRNIDGTLCTAASSGNDKKIYDAVMNAIITNRAMQDNREGKFVRITDFDVGKFSADINDGKLPTVTTGGSGWNGVLYIADTTPNGVIVNTRVTGTTTAAPTTQRAVRLVNGAILPSVTAVNPATGRTETVGMTVVSENPVYIQGNYNTGGSSPLSNSGTPTSPTVSGYTRKPSAVIADAINVLSSGWADAKSDDGDVNLRVATSTTINTALVSGNVATPNEVGAYSGGGENFIRLQEDWKDKNFTYYGSMVQLYKSAQATAPLRAAGQLFKSPASNKWYYDNNFRNSSPPGKLQISAYLQQQRWFQVY